MMVNQFKKIALLFFFIFSSLSCGSKLDRFTYGQPDSDAWKNHNLKSTEICIVSHNDNREGYAAITSRNHEDYSKTHGYSYQFLTGRVSGPLFKDPRRTDRIFREGLYWQKISAVKNELNRPECRWVMWMDADTIFTNFDKKIDQIIQKYGFLIYNDRKVENHLILSAEEVIPEVTVNAGVFLIRNSAWSKDFFQHVQNAYPYYKNHGLPEQDFLQDAAYSRIELGQYQSYMHQKNNEPSFENLMEFITVVPQRVMNSFHRSGMNDNKNAQWQEGDFIAHLSGSSHPQRIEMLKTLEAKILR